MDRPLESRLHFDCVLVREGHNGIGYYGINFEEGAKVFIGSLAVLDRIYDVEVVGPVEEFYVNVVRLKDSQRMRVEPDRLREKNNHDLIERKRSLELMEKFEKKAKKRRIVEW